MRKALVTLVFTALAFSLVACGTSKPILIVDEPLVIGHQTEAQGKQFASLWNPSRAEALEARSSGGSSFNAAAPGAIGGTTSSTGQFTTVCTGTSPCTLPATTGAASFNPNGNTTGLSTFIDTAGGGATAGIYIGAANTATPHNLANSLLSDGANNIYLGTATQDHLQVGGTDKLTVGATAVSVPGGVTLQSTGGTAPTLTAGCNGAGSAVRANANCTGAAAPFACCSGAGAGTCPDSTNNRGQILTQTAAVTTCTLTFSASGTWSQPPVCGFFDANASITPVAYSVGAVTTTTQVINFASVANKLINYLCM